MTELMIAAENQLKPKFAHIPFWSPALKQKGQTLAYYNARVQSDVENGDLGKSVERPACVPPDHSITTTEELHEKQMLCKNAWCETSANKENLRKQHLWDQAEKAHVERNIEVESALKHIINLETSKALHQRQGGVMKDAHPGSLKKVLVSVPNSSVPASTTAAKCDAWEEIDDDATISSLFLLLNEKNSICQKFQISLQEGFSMT